MKRFQQGMHHHRFKTINLYTTKPWLISSKAEENHSVKVQRCISSQGPRATSILTQKSKRMQVSVSLVKSLPILAM